LGFKALPDHNLGNYECKRYLTRRDSEFVAADLE
jgi:hypothetical protein